MSFQPPAAPIYPPSPGDAQPPRRPAVVTAAVIVMLVGAALGLINGIATTVATSQIVHDFRSRAASTDATPAQINNVARAVRWSYYSAATVTLVLAVIVVVLAVLLLRASKAARIITWVLIGISLCCGVCGSIGTLARGSTSITAEGVSDATAKALLQALEDSVPSWVGGVSTGLTGLQLLGYIAVAVLLALPAANAFFRHRPPAEPPPMPAPPAAPPTL